MYTCSGYRDMARGERRRDREAGVNMALIREMEELRARTQQMEKTLK